MAGGFNNPLVGGVGKLIRDFIQSPNYVAGDTGWTVNKDGTVEFNSGTFRGTLILTNAGVALLVYNGTPAAGNLVAAISPIQGFDQFNNEYYNGLTLYPNFEGISGGEVVFPFETGPPNETGPLAGAYLQAFKNSDTDFDLRLALDASGIGAAFVPIIDLAWDNVNKGAIIAFAEKFSAGPPTGWATGNGGISVTKNGFQIGAGAIGKCYSGNFSYSLAGVPTAGGNTVINAGITTNEEDTDYGTTGAEGEAPGSNWAAGVFTSPVKAKYLCSGSSWASDFGAGYIRRIVFQSNIGGAGFVNVGAAETTAAPATFTKVVRLDVGDQIRFLTHQESGATKTMIGDISVDRLLT